MKQELRKIGIIFLFLFSLCYPAFIALASEGEDSIKWLMQRPVSMWDFGLEKLNTLVVSSESFSRLRIDTDITFGFRAYYQEKEGKILIFGIILNAMNKKRCVESVNEIRRIGGIRADLTPIPPHPFKYSNYAHSFIPNTGDSSQYEDAAMNIDKKIGIVIKMQGGECNGDLISSEVYVKEY